MINKQLNEHLNAEILPEYDQFPIGHDCNHIARVTENMLEVAEQYRLNKDMCIAIVAYHDLGATDTEGINEIQGGNEAKRR